MAPFSKNEKRFLCDMADAMMPLPFEGAVRAAHLKGHRGKYRFSKTLETCLAFGCVDTIFDNEGMEFLVLTPRGEEIAQMLIETREIWRSFRRKHFRPTWSGVRSFAWTIMLGYAAVPAIFIAWYFGHNALLYGLSGIAGHEDTTSSKPMTSGESLTILLWFVDVVIVSATPLVRRFLSEVKEL